MIFFKNKNCLNYCLHPNITVYMKSSLLDKQYLEKERERNNYLPANKLKRCHTYTYI